MIAALAELFVERVPREESRTALMPASSLLVVDACGGVRRVADLTRLVESSGPLRASYVEFVLVSAVPDSASFDQVWLFVDCESDLSYCGLYVRELAERFAGARVRLVGVGPVDLDDCDLVLDEAMGGAAPFWRRGRELSRGADLLRERLLGS
ncbi:MAG: hypothetical protein JHC98_08605 [Thermoleophilaceae bacterium]|nr:hypothetical protein [Thermoleophilaceae bacterium]